MKTLKKTVARFQKLDATQMKNIEGGVWVDVTDADENKQLLGSKN